MTILDSSIFNTQTVIASSKKINIAQGHTTEPSTLFYLYNTQGHNTSPLKKSLNDNENFHKSKEKP